jgi:hypothetical protein
MSTVTGTTSPGLPAKAGPSRAAWREEMLGELLNAMRERKPTDLSEGKSAEAALAPAWHGKGRYVDLYV